MERGLRTDSTVRRKFFIFCISVLGSFLVFLEVLDALDVLDFLVLIVFLELLVFLVLLYV